MVRHSEEDAQGEGSKTKEGNIYTPALPFLQKLQ